MNCLFKPDKSCTCSRLNCKNLNNKPDTVTNLREDEYSNVVKTCNDIFWITK